MSDDRITIPLTPDIVEALNRFTSDEASKGRTRQDAFRYIVREWLVRNGYLSPVAAMPGGRYRQVARVLPRSATPALPPPCEVGDILVLQCRIAMLHSKARLTIELPGYLSRVCIETTGDVEFTKAPGPRRRPVLEVGDFITLRCPVVHVPALGRASIRVPGLPEPTVILVPSDVVLVKRQADEPGPPL